MTTFTERNLAPRSRAIPICACMRRASASARRFPFEFEASPLARRFETLWAQLGGPALEKEYQFHPPRRWRFDYCNREKMIAIELHGGIWSEGRHVRGGGFLRDREKMNQAQLDGWIVIELGTGQITAANLEPLIERMKR